ncbi:MAG: hypothetical protein R3E51_16130 [Rhizobiaceae bacterium]
MPGVIHAIGAGGQDALVSVDCNGDRIIARVTPYLSEGVGAGAARSPAFS